MARATSVSVPLPDGRGQTTVGVPSAPAGGLTVIDPEVALAMDIEPTTDPWTPNPTVRSRNIRPLVLADPIVIAPVPFASRKMASFVADEIAASATPLPDELPVMLMPVACVPAMAIDSAGSA